MKRAGNLMPRIASPENLYEAFLRASRGKQGKTAVVQFRNNLDENLLQMRRQLLDGTFVFGNYNRFTIRDPKQRVICAVPFPERVAFHAMMRVCHPVFDNYQIYDSYASRVGKGTYKALERAMCLAKKYEWFAKLDIRKYFDSISHRVLMGQLCRLFKDKQLLQLFADLLDTYHVQEGRGLPIGNLTSQYFANHYLSPADHYMKEQLHVPALVRYMDDVLLFADDKQDLLPYVRKYEEYTTDKLRLCIHSPVVNKTKYGVPFLGYVVYGGDMRLNKASRRRFSAKMKHLAFLLDEGCISQEKYSERASCLLAFINKASASDFMYKVSRQKGTYPVGL